MGFFSSGNDQSETTSAPWKPARDPLRSIMGQATDLSQVPSTMFPGQTYAGFDPRQVQGMRGITDYAGGAAPGMVGASQNAWHDALGAPDVGNNPYVNNMLDVQSGLINRNLNENLLPGADMNAVATGSVGGSAQGIERGLAQRGALDAIANAAAQTQLGAYGQGVVARGNALNQAGNQTNLGLLPSQYQMQVGDIYQQQDQRAIDEAIARHDFAQNEPWNRLGQYSNFASGIGNMGGVTRSETPSPSGFDKLLGTATTLGGAFLGGGGGSGFFGGGADMPVTTPTAGGYTSNFTTPQMQQMSSNFGSGFFN